VVTYLSIIGKLVGVLGSSGFLHCLVGWLGVTSVRCWTNMLPQN